MQETEIPCWTVGSDMRDDEVVQLQITHSTLPT
jgi:hypothetical protein